MQGSLWFYGGLVGGSVNNEGGAWVLDFADESLKITSVSCPEDYN